MIDTPFYVNKPIQRDLGRRAIFLEDGGYMAIINVAGSTDHFLEEPASSVSSDPGKGKVKFTV